MPVPRSINRVHNYLSAWQGLFFLLLVGAANGSAWASTPPELHVLIDVSGSMKQTDPHNLRRPALRLLGDLLPPSAKIGIWFFGDRVSPMLKTATADAAIKARVRQISAKIRSNEPFTDIPAALKEAAAHWSKDTDRNILLLSDGMVDISPDKTINARAQEQLLQKIVPELAAKHIKVHTIALSKDADAHLLAQIASETGGLFVEAESADALQRAFLKIFEAVAPRDGLPLKDNKFLVDHTVKELTILAFRDKSNQPTKLKLPDGQIVDAQSSRTKAGWRWDDSAGRDLITIKNPLPGQWQILGVLDPDNRALIITDLKLKLTNIPTRVYPGEEIGGALMLMNHDQPITKAALTQSVHAQIDEQKGDKVIQVIPLNDQGENPDIIGGDGKFDYEIRLIDPAGIYSLVATAISPTFQRDWRQNFAMAPRPPVQMKLDTSTVTVEPAANQHEPDSHHTKATIKTRRVVQVTQDPTVLVPDSAELTGKWQCENAGSGQHPADIPIKWHLSHTIMFFSTPSNMKTDCVLHAKLDAKLTTGREISLQLPPFKVAAPPLSNTSSGHKESVQETHKSTRDEINWMLIITVNVITLLLIGLGAWLWRRQVKRTNTKLIEEAQSA